MITGDIIVSEHKPCFLNINNYNKQHLYSALPTPQGALQEVHLWF